MRSSSCAVLALALSAGVAHADTITLGAAADGSYSSSGAHSDAALTKNHGGGDFPLLVESRAYFAFDLSGVTGDVTAATFTANLTEWDLYSNGYPVYFFQLHEVADAANVLGGAGGLPAYADLADGSVFDMQGAHHFLGGTDITWTLNADGLAAIEAAGGGTFVMGLILNDFVMDTGTALWTDGRLTLTTAGGGGNPIPEPASAALALLGVAGMALRRRVR